MARTTSQTGAGEDTAHAVVEPAHRVLDGLGRLAATATIYGDAHPKVAAMAAETASVVQSLGAAACGFLVDDILAAHAGRTTSAFVGRVARDLDRLGALRVDLTGDVDADALVAFARFLRRATAMRGALEFEAADFSSLPASIVVTPRMYGSGEGGGSGDGATDGAAPARKHSGAVPTLQEAALATLPRGSVGIVLDAPTRRVVERLLELAAREGDGDAGGDAAAPQNLREAVRAAAESLGRNVRKAAATGGRPIDEILGGLKNLLTRVLPDGSASELHQTLSVAIDAHLRDAFAAEPSARAGKKREVARDTELDPPEEEVVASIRSFTAAAPRFRPVEEADPVEELSILLQLHGSGPEAPAPDRIEARIAAAAEQGLNEEALAVLDGWIRHACEKATGAQFDELVRPVVAGLHARAPLAFATSLLGTAGDAPARIVETAWPYLAEALLVADRDSDARLRENLADLLVRVAPRRIRGEAARLAALVRPPDPANPPPALASPRASLFPVYDVLYGLRPETCWPAAVFSAFAKSTGSHPFAAALEGLLPGDARARKLLESAFREGEESEDTRTLAAGIIVRRLRATRPEKRDEPAVHAAVRALGFLPCRAAFEFLEAVVVERKFLFRWAWPEDVRAAAVEARISADYRTVARVSGGGSA